MKLFVSIFFLFTSLVCTSQLNSQFVSMKPLNKTLVTFNYTGAIQTWTVPAGVNFVYVEAFGAQGGNQGPNIGGRGGKVSCSLPVTPGQVLHITVGGQSSNNIAVFGFGGNGGSATNHGTVARAGGGLSGISSADPITQANAFLIAAGGGGCASSGFAGSGGAGGGLNGTDAPSTYGGTPTRGRGATQLAGGAAGSPFDANSILPTAGSAISGGTGGSVSGLNSNWNGGGGGGAGFFGGGGAAGGGDAQGSGGGGSSWTSNSCINVQNISNSNSGHGYIHIYY
jgi:hypothetical protein